MKYYNKIIKLQGVTFPAMHIMIAKWAPPNERSVLASIVYAGKIKFLLIEKNYLEFLLSKDIIFLFHLNKKSGKVETTTSVTLFYGLH